MFYSFMYDLFTWPTITEMCETRMHDGGFYQRPALPHSGDEVCDFCEAIVGHWRDVLTANTTEVEFKQVRDESKSGEGILSVGWLSGLVSILRNGELKT